MMSLFLQEDGQAELKQALLEHLLRPQAAVSPKYLYDALGSRLFEAITELPEYSPTREEREILISQLPLIAAQLPAAAALIDLGAGSCRKAASLIPVLNPAHYLAVDIAEDFLHESLATLGREFPGLPMSALATDFSGLESFATGRAAYFLLSRIEHRQLSSVRRNTFSVWIAC